MNITGRFLGFLILLIILLPGLLLQVQPGHELWPTQMCLAADDQKPATENRLVQDLQRAIARVQPFLEHYGYAALFLAVLVEGVGLVAPGQTLLIAAALMAARGELNLMWVLFWAFIAACLGNGLGYLLGRWGGRPLLRKFRVNDKHLQRFKGYFARYGHGVILFARFFDGLRQLNGIVAGLMQMPWQEFTLWSLLGAILWTGGWGLGTYFLEKEIVTLHLTIRQVEPWIAALSLFGVLSLMIYLFWRRRKPDS